MTISSLQQTELERPVSRIAYFIEFSMSSGALRVCNSNMTYTWNGYEWLGMGLVGSISPVEESSGGAPSAMTFGLNVADSSLLSLALVDASIYRGRPAKMYFCPLDEQFRLVGDPQICWRGIMDTMSIGVDGDAGSITLKCETSAYSLKRRPSMRLNAPQHKARIAAKYAGLVDTGLDMQQDLIANPQIWVSKRFQQI